MTCKWCNDEGIVHTHDGQIIGPCECSGAVPKLPDFSPCKCEHAYASLGRDGHVSMGMGWVRTTTHPRCPEHALCQGYTPEVRAKEWNGEWLYCNVHGKKWCPDA